MYVSLSNINSQDFTTSHFPLIESPRMENKQGLEGMASWSFPCLNRIIYFAVNNLLLCPLSRSLKLLFTGGRMLDLNWKDSVENGPIPTVGGSK